MAAPLSQFFTDPDPIIRTAVEGTIGILKSAVKFGSTELKSFVLISSVAAVMSPHDPPYTFTEKDWNALAEAEVARLGKEIPGPQIYRASKTASERAFWKFRDDHDPTFTMTAINPAFVSGPPLVLPQDPEQLNETVRNVWTVLSGQDWKLNWLGGSRVTCDVRDVGRMMAFGIEHPKEANGERYLVFSGLGSEQAIADILRAHYPNRKDLIKVGNPGAGYLPDYAFPKDGLKLDASKAVRATSQEFTGYEKIILDSAKAFETFL